MTELVNGLIPISDQDYLRYGRQLLLPEWGEAGQQRVASKTVTIIGLGGLGCPALQYLAGAGVGRLVLIDGDRVSLSNLPRQILYRPDQVGMKKAEAAAEWIRLHNPNIGVETVAKMMGGNELAPWLIEADVVLDCTDNFDTRHLINRLCFEAQVPLISAAAIAWQGQLMPITSTGPCFQCLTGGNSTEQASCSEAGVVGPVLGTIASMQALLALRVLLEVSVSPLLHRFDGQTLSWQSFSVKPDVDCPVCGTQTSTQAKTAAVAEDL